MQWGDPVLGNLEPAAHGAPMPSSRVVYSQPTPHCHEAGSGIPTLFRVEFKSGEGIWQQAGKSGLPASASFGSSWGKPRVSSGLLVAVASNQVATIASPV